MPSIPSKPEITIQPWVNGQTKLNQSNLTRGVNSNVSSLKGAVDGVIDVLPQINNPTVSDNTLAVLPYDKVAVISLSANRTFTFASAPTGCIPEYKAVITNSHLTSAVTLTFTGVSHIMCNDIGCVVNANAISIPPSTTIECSIMNGNCVALNFAAE